jgi:hypothetical protein
MPRTTAHLLEIWRAAERAADAAKRTADAALAAAEAAETAALAAREAAVQAGVTLDEATHAQEHAHVAYAERQEEQFRRGDGPVGSRHD